MGSVIEKSRFSKEVKLKLGIFLVYFLATLTFVYFGLQPASKPEEVYATESAEATATLTISARNNTDDNANNNTSNDAKTSITAAKTLEQIPVKPIEKVGTELEVPEQIAGSYSVHQNKTLIVGHSSTIFKNLKYLQLGDTITYSEKEYTITKIEEKLKQDISMAEVLKSETEDTLVLMTCAGDPVGNGDYTHRLIVIARVA